MEEFSEITKLCCVFCSKTRDEVELTDMASNSLKCGDDIIEFGDLLFEVLHLQVTRRNFK
jgi:hypothetical protein